MDCPAKVAAALATLPWVEENSVRPDRKTRQVRFTLRDRAAFDPDAMRAAIGKRGFNRVAVLAGPTDS